MKTRLFCGLVLGCLFLSTLPGCAPPAAPSLTIETVWGRPSPTIPTAGGLYMVIENSGSASDKLLSGKSPACGSIEVQAVAMKSDGTLGLNPVDEPLEIPAGGMLELKPDGVHILCMEKDDDKFKRGAKIDLTLVFEKSGEKTVSAEISLQ